MQLLLCARTCIVSCFVVHVAFVHNNSEATFLRDRRPPASSALDAADERLTRSITDVLDMFLQLQPQVGNGIILPLPRVK